MMDFIKRYKWHIMSITIILAIIVVFVYVDLRHDNNYYKNIQITIKGNTLYIVENEIRNIISNNGKYALMAIPIRYINLRAIEQKIKQDSRIQDAHVYQDAQYILHIDIEQKQPAIRIFTVDGKSFYLDKQGNRMPLSLYSVANVPVCTTYPSYFNENNDKIFATDVLDLLRLAEQDSYLKDCISYINVIDTTSIEIIPKTGTPIVRISIRDSKQEVLEKIKNFYLQVIPNVGWGYYTYIDLRFKNEIIALKK